MRSRRPRDKKVHFSVSAEFHFPHGPVPEGGFRHAAGACGVGQGDFSFCPQPERGRKFCGERFGRPSETDAFFPGRGNAFGLASAYVFPFVLGGEGKHLKHEIGDEGAEKVLVAPGVEQGHVEYQNIHLSFSGEDAPLPLYFLIVAAQPVDAGHAYEVSGPESAEHGPVYCGR